MDELPLDSASSNPALRRENEAITPEGQNTETQYTKQERQNYLSIAQKLLLDLERSPGTAKNSSAELQKQPAPHARVPGLEYASPETSQPAVNAISAGSAGDPSSAGAVASSAHAARGTPPARQHSPSQRPQAGTLHFAPTNADEILPLQQHSASSELPLRIKKRQGAARSSGRSAPKQGRDTQGGLREGVSRLPRRPHVSSIIGNIPANAPRTGQPRQDAVRRNRSHPPTTRDCDASRRVRQAIAQGVAADLRSIGGKRDSAPMRKQCTSAAGTDAAQRRQAPPPQPHPNPLRSETPQPRPLPAAATPNVFTPQSEPVPKAASPTPVPCGVGASRAHLGVLQLQAGNVRQQLKQLRHEAANSLAGFNGIMTRVRGALVPAVASLAHRAGQRGGEVHALQRQLDTARAQLQEAQATAQHANGSAALATHAAQAAAKAAAEQMESARRMRDWLGDVRGAVRVLCRVRPHASDNTDSVLQFAGLTADGSREGVLLRGGHSRPSYEEAVGARRRLQRPPQTDARHSGLLVFDRVFRPESTQSDVYDELKGIVRAALPAQPAAFRPITAEAPLPPKRLCVFAWGATGSGKTHTLWGGSGQAAGSIPRALADVFRVLHKRCSEALHSSTQQAFSDTWNNNAFLSGAAVFVAAWEVLHDCVKPLSAASASKPSAPGQGSIVPKNVVEVPVHSFKEAMRTVQIAQHDRAQGSTHLNEHSSRGHLLCSVRLAPSGTGARAGTDAAPPQAGHLLFVDLAGAERALEAGTMDDAARLREAGGVNKGLVALSQVLTGMAAGAHVSNTAVGRVRAAPLPFRDSPLTQCLRPYLGVPGARVAMIATASGELSRMRDTERTLKFAAGVASAAALQ